MKNITLCRPIVLRSSLDDMTASQKEIALDLLSNRKVLVPGKDGLRFEKMNTQNHSKLPKFFIYGSEAVCYYRQSLDLPDVSIRDIETDDIVMNIEDFDTLYDIKTITMTITITAVPCLFCPVSAWQMHFVCTAFQECG